MFYQILVLPQKKRGMIINDKNGIHGLLQEFPKDLRLRNKDIRTFNKNYS